MEQPKKWGYVVAAALVVVLVATVTPLFSLGLIFGQFAQENGKRTTDLVVVNIVGLAASHLIGIVATPLLNFYSARVVALIGAALVVLGSFLTVSVHDFNDLLVYYGLVQGFGIGILIPAHFASLQSHFNVHLTLVVSLVYVFTALCSIVYPTFIVFVLQTYGFRSTLFVLAAISLTTIPTSLLLYPGNVHETETLALLKEKPSLFSLKLFKDPLYLNISIGLSLGFIADTAFFTVVPQILKNDNFSLTQIGQLLALSFAGDLVMTAGLAELNLWVDLGHLNRKIVFFACVVIIVFRLIFMHFSGIKWKIASLVVLGGTKALIHTPTAAILSDNFPKNFASAYSLYRVICGGTTLVMGAVLAFGAKNDFMIIHLLNGANAFCAVTWLCEGIVRKTPYF